MIKLIRKLIAILRGGAGSREILLGLMVGFLIGMVPGINLTLVACVFLVLILNANFGLVMLGLLAGKITCLLLAPVTFEIGYTLIHSAGLEGLIKTASDTPVIALMNLDSYCLIGGLPIGILGGLVLGLIVSTAITKVRKKIVGARKDNEKLEALLGKWYIKLIIRVLAGKKPKKGDMAEALDKDSPLLRKKGIIVAVSAAVLLIITEVLVLTFGARVGLEHGFSRLNGAEVNIAEADISLFSGKADLRGVQVTDPETPANNLFATDHLAANFSVSDLLRKRLVVELVAMDQLRMDEARKQPGKVYEKPPVKDDGDGADTAEEGELPMLDKLIKNWETYKRYAEKGKDVLDRALEARKARKQLMSAGDPKKRLKNLKALAKQYGYFSLSAKTWLQDKPTWELQELRAGGISLGSMLPVQTLVVTNVSSAPELQAEPITLALNDDSANETAACEVKLSDDFSSSYELRGNIRDIALEQVNMGEDIPVTVNDGNGQATGKGRLADGSLAVPFDLALTDLDLTVPGNEKVLGMEPATAQEVFAAIKTLGIKGEVVGSLDAVRVNVDYDALQDTLTEALKKAGKDMLAKKMNKELDKAKGKAKEEADKAISKEVSKLKDKYGKDLEKKIGTENYKKIEGVADGVDSKKLGDIAGKLLGGGDKESTEKDADEDKKPSDEETDKKKKSSLLDFIK